MFYKFTFRMLFLLGIHFTVNAQQHLINPVLRINPFVHLGDGGDLFTNNWGTSYAGVGALIHNHWLTSVSLENPNNSSPYESAVAISQRYQYQFKNKVIYPEFSWMIPIGSFQVDNYHRNIRVWRAGIGFGWIFGEHLALETAVLYERVTYHSQYDATTFHHMTFQTGFSFYLYPIKNK